MTPKFTLNQLLVRLAGLTGLSVEPAKAVVTAKFGTTASKHFSVTVDHKHMTLNGGTIFLASYYRFNRRLDLASILERFVFAGSRRARALRPGCDRLQS